MVRYYQESLAFAQELLYCVVDLAMGEGLAGGGDSLWYNGREYIYGADIVALPRDDDIDVGGEPFPIEEILADGAQPTSLFNGAFACLLACI